MNEAQKRVSKGTRRRRPTRKTNSGKPRTQKNTAGKAVGVTRAFVALSVNKRSRAPKLINKNGSVVVDHEEYIGDISAAISTWFLTTYSINPGLSATFPWLSSIASRYESYIFESLSFSYKPVCPTTTPGSMMLAIDYDASDPIPPNKATIMSYQGAVRTAPWGETTFNAMGSDLRKFGVQRYIRGSATTGDIKTTDVGNFFIASQGTPGVATGLGELYVKYRVKLFTPQLATVAPANTTRVATQIATITVPQAGAISMSARVYGDALNPLFWLGDEFDAGKSIALWINTLMVPNGLLSIFCRDAYGKYGPGDPSLVFRTFSNYNLMSSNKDLNINAGVCTTVNGMPYPGKVVDVGSSTNWWLPLMIKTATNTTTNGGVASGFGRYGLSYIPFLITRPLLAGAIQFIEIGYTALTTPYPSTYNLLDFVPVTGANIVLDFARTVIAPQLLPNVMAAGTKLVDGTNTFEYLTDGTEEPLPKGRLPVKSP